MQIIINGSKETIQPGSLLSLVQSKGLKADTLVVEHNRQIIKQGRWDEIELQENDLVELLSFVGGG